MTARLLAAIFVSLFVVGCLEVIDHGPADAGAADAGGCVRNLDCACNEVCAPDGGVSACVPQTTGTCSGDLDCASFGHNYLCLPAARGPHFCGYNECQVPDGG